jgi:hypothetical protein
MSHLPNKFQTDEEQGKKAALVQGKRGDHQENCCENSRIPIDGEDLAFWNVSLLLG